MLVRRNAGVKRYSTAEAGNRRRHFCALLVAALIGALNTGYEGLAKRDEARIQAAAEANQIRDRALPKSATRRYHDN